MNTGVREESRPGARKAKQVFSNYLKDIFTAQVKFGDWNLLLKE